MDWPETHSNAENTEPSSETPPSPRMPWEDRKRLGVLRAYWRTAKIVLFDPSQLEKLLDKPVDEKHARYFRRTTMRFTCMITLLIAVALPARLFPSTYGPGTSMARAESGLLTILAALGQSVLLLTGLFLATRSLEWFSSPKNFDLERQDRAILLSCYACGPILIVAAIGTAASMALVLSQPAQDMRTTLGLFRLTWWAIFMAWWPASVRALYFTTGRRIGRSALTAIALPLIWFGQQLLVWIIPVSVVQWYLISSSMS